MSEERMMILNRLKKGKIIDVFDDEDGEHVEITIE